MGSKQHSLVASASVPASELLSGVPALTSLYGGMENCKIKQALFSSPVKVLLRAIDSKGRGENF